MVRSLSDSGHISNLQKEIFVRETLVFYQIPTTSLNFPGTSRNSGNKGTDVSANCFVTSTQIIGKQISQMRFLFDQKFSEPASCREISL